MGKNIFIPGLDDFNLSKLQALPEAADYTFHQLLSLAELQPADKDPQAIEHVLHEAENRLRTFSGSIDAIVGYWDYPVSTMIPLLCRKFGLPAAPLRSVMACEHKYWSRVEQQEVIPECVPPFQSVDPFDDAALTKMELDYPFWLKPIKAHSSQLGFKIESDQDFRESMEPIRQDIGHFAAIFNHLLEQVDVPSKIRPVDGGYCIAEGIISGWQCTVEGFVFDGEPQTYGVIDSVREPGSSSFARFQYPSSLDDPVKERIAAAAKKVMAHVGYDNAAFNIEFFYDEAQDRLWLLEINTRISQSHSYLFDKVDGKSNFSIMLDLGLGRRPEITPGQGTYRCAGKFFLRKYEDALVQAVPSEEELRRLHAEFPEAAVKVSVEAGTRLSELPTQESYSYELAEVMLGGENEAELLQKHERCQELLTFTFAE